MKVGVGVVFPQTEIGQDPSVIRDFAQTAEGLGFTYILVFDHVLGALHADRDPKLWGPYTERDQFHEPLTLCAYLSGVTSRIGFATGVLVLPQRQTALVAKQAAEVDVLSGGRLRLGIGTGWNYVEYEALNEDFRTRGRRQEEQVEVLRRLWTEPTVDFTGRWHRIDRAGILPRPARPIPIWFGGFSEAAFSRAARVGDGFFFSRAGALAGGWQPGGDRGSLDATFPGLTRVGELLAEAGRDRSTFGIEGRTHYNFGPENWAADLEVVAAAGFDQVALNTMASGLDTPQKHIDALRAYAAEVGMTSGG